MSTIPAFITAKATVEPITVSSESITVASEPIAVSSIAMTLVSFKISCMTHV